MIINPRKICISLYIGSLDGPRKKKSSIETKKIIIQIKSFLFIQYFYLNQ